MKKFFFLPFLLLVFSVLSAQSPTNVSANVQKINGKAIFIMSEPVSEYDVVFSKEIKILWSNSQVNTPEEIAIMLIRKCEKESDQEHVKYDAVIINQQKATAIKFK